MSEQFLNGTSAHIRLFTAIHSFSAVHQLHFTELFTSVHINRKNVIDHVSDILLKLPAYLDWDTSNGKDMSILVAQLHSVIHNEYCVTES